MDTKKQLESKIMSQKNLIQALNSMLTEIYNCMRYCPICRSDLILERSACSGCDGDECCDTAYWKECFKCRFSIYESGNIDIRK